MKIQKGMLKEGRTFNGTLARRKLKREEERRHEEKWA